MKIGGDTLTKLRDIRKAAHQTQTEVAKAIGVNQVAISRYETGARELSVPVAKQIANHFGISWVRFYEDDEKKV